ncbi:DUF4870 domain-containing protein [Paenibacillus aquistagni]|uniref:DUF4870 domain-containing protein n=1 Tax=Paenibacillus aquistagni TaxID=1852522 RepID=A0A1X7IVK2_9BACL|nr:DUF4870 domain-containing protein [Paenibacillus aquistagni]SMG18924.1 protein of unknown function [Paenibacillus aquistagni]
MKPSQVLSSLCYFSIFFAPFLFPLLIWLIADNEVKDHAKKALWSHIVPTIVLIIGMITSFSVGIGSESAVWVSILLVVTYGLFILIWLYYFIWNIVKGLRVLKAA